MGIKVDQWGNVWDAADTERTRPVQPHVELEPEKARCGCVEYYVYRTQNPQGDFEWKCACGKVYPGLHH